ncbi:MAG: transcriptional regulator NrdR [Bacteriovoracia bacterium]
MRCPYCSSFDNKVIDSRINQIGDITRRRRECMSCGGRYTTYERVEVVMPFVIKKDGRREPFQREKIFSGILKACEKRAITTDQIEKLVSDVEQQIAALSVREISYETIGKLVMHALHQIDKVAYVRFASVYREFQDVEDFVADLRAETEAAQQEFPHIEPHEENNTSLE